ncbi:unnamed protein product, partial [Didymodactylos carnosus]
IFMCLDLFIWYVRILHLFAASERLGPKLLMILKTMKDLFFFICFILIFLFAYSVTAYSLITTNEQVHWIIDKNSSSSTWESRNFTLLNDGTDLWSWVIIRHVIDWGMWKIFGEVDLNDYPQGSDSTLN